MRERKRDDSFALWFLYVFFSFVFGFSNVAVDFCLSCVNINIIFNSN